MTAVLITLAVVLAIVVVILMIVIYHQMLLVNEVNKRLLLLSENAVENERATMGELNQAIQERDNAIADKLDPNNIRQEEVEDEYDNFNPHDALDSLEG